MCRLGDKVGYLTLSRWARLLVFRSLLFSVASYVWCVQVLDLLPPVAGRG